MKIGSIDPKTNVAAPVADRSKAAVGAAEGSGLEPSSKVALSQAATLKTAGDADGSFDGAKVERIAQAIRDRQFVINPDAIADKLIRNAEELLGRKVG